MYGLRPITLKTLQPHIQALCPHSQAAHTARLAGVIHVHVYNPDVDERILREDSLGTAATTGQYLAEVTYVKQVYSVRAHGIQRHIARSYRIRNATATNYLFLSRKIAYLAETNIPDMATQKFSIEYDMRSVPVALLWNYISTPNGLGQWFADSVSATGSEYTFTWSKQSESATVLSSRHSVAIRFRWHRDYDKPSPKPYFEMRIAKNELTGETAIFITDFSPAEELADARELWNSQIETLRTRLGC